MTDQPLNRKKVLVIAGPTATGKTALALKLADQFNGDLISADSRQVYKGLDVVTGKDIPSGYTKLDLDLPDWGQTTIYTNGQNRIWGVDVIEASQQWSAGTFAKFARAVIAFCQAENKLPILVGGTGLYLKTIYEDLPLGNNPPDNKLRAQLEKLNTEELREKLRTINPVRLSGLNQSDRNNPRRLIRAIEMGKPRFEKTDQGTDQRYDCLLILTSAPMLELMERIRSRVKQRLESPWVEELKLWEQIKGSDPAKSSLGYEYLNLFSQGKVTKDQLISMWTQADREYAKRQLTWFRKQDKFHWFDISQKDWLTQVVAQVSSWYS